jgi:hypothetical protein
VISMCLPIPAAAPAYRQAGIALALLRSDWKMDVGGHPPRSPRVGCAPRPLLSKSACKITVVM